MARRVRLVGEALVCIAIALLLPATGVAQIVTPSIPLALPDDKNVYGTIGYAHQFETDIDGISGDADFTRESVIAVLGRRFELSDRLDLFTQVVYNFNSYDFGNSGILSWDETHTVTGLILGAYEIDDEWDVMAGVLVRTSAEGGANFADGVDPGGFLGFRKQWSDSLNVGAIFGVVRQIENGVGFLPLPLVDWQISDDLKFKLGIVPVAAVGYGPELTWTPGDTWELGMGATLQRRRFRLDNTPKMTAKNPAMGKGVGDETAIPIFAKVGFRPTPTSNISLMAGVTVGGQLTIYDRYGSKIVQKNYDPAPMIALQAKFLF